MLPATGQLEQTINWVAPPRFGRFKATIDLDASKAADLDVRQTFTAVPNANHQLTLRVVYAFRIPTHAEGVVHSIQLQVASATQNARLAIGIYDGTNAPNQKLFESTMTLPMITTPHTIDVPLLNPVVAPMGFWLAVLPTGQSITMKVEENEVGAATSHADAADQLPVKFRAAANPVDFRFGSSLLVGPP
jgi:hypothetical protein